jgi:CubicO group peptidase (beta-lactamase class C family)
MLLIGCDAPVVKTKEVKAEAWGRFEADLESLRQQMKVPGMSAAVVKDGKLAWGRGFGGL